METIIGDYIGATMRIHPPPLSTRQIRALLEILKGITNLITYTILGAPCYNILQNPILIIKAPTLWFIL